jgi:hypothetical protein
MFTSSGNGGDRGESMPAILNSEVMGATPTEPDETGWRDYVFYIVMALIFTFAIIAGKCGTTP